MAVLSFHQGFEGSLDFVIIYSVQIKFMFTTFYLTTNTSYLL